MLRGTKIPPTFSFLAKVNPACLVLWLLGACALLTHLTLEHTRLGRYAFASGSNEAAAVYAGILYVPHYGRLRHGGMLTGLAGMIEASRLMTGQRLPARLRAAGHSSG